MSDNKLNIPYYQIAKAVLMKKKRLSEEQVIDEIENSTFEQIEEQVNAKKSVSHAVRAIIDYVGIEAAGIENSIYTGDKYSEKISITILGAAAEYRQDDPNKVIMDTIFAVHDGWVKDNAEKFIGDDEQYQYMPSQLIGWRELKKDLLFVKPIMEAGGLEVNEEQLEKEYNRRVKEFFLDNKIYAPSDLMRLLGKGEKFYSAWEGQEDIIEALKDESFVASTLIPQIDDYGIGKTYEIKDKILFEIAKNPKREDLERLTKIERVMVNNEIDEKIKIATEKLELEKKKNGLVDDILIKADKLNNINKQIEIEINKRKSEEEGPNFEE